jgi:hypothetical protein
MNAMRAHMTVMSRQIVLTQKVPLYASATPDTVVMELIAQVKYDLKFNNVLLSINFKDGKYALGFNYWNHEKVCQPHDLEKIGNPV